MPKYLIITGILACGLVLLFTIAYFVRKRMKLPQNWTGNTATLRYGFGYHASDKEAHPDPLDLDWDNFDHFQAPEYPHSQTRVYEARCVSVQPRTYEDLQKSEEKLAESSSSGSSANEDSPSAACKLKFTIQYNTVSSTLAVHIRAAKHLFLHAKGAVAYYAMLKMFPQTHRTFNTRAIKSGTPTEFRETFEFQIEQHVLDQNLKIMLCFFDRFSHHDVIGELRVDLADLESRGLLLSREILLCKEINRVPKEKSLAGEIILSLGYLRLTERLAVVLISAKNLPVLDTGQPPDPCIEVILQHGGHILKHKKTYPKHKDCNPVFNESLTFHIPHGILHQSSLTISLKHDDGTGNDLTLGTVFLGPEATGLQFEHWNEMRVNSKPIARWHKLQAD